MFEEVPAQARGAGPCQQNQGDHGEQGGGLVGYHHDHCRGRAQRSRGEQDGHHRDARIDAGEQEKSPHRRVRRIVHVVVVVMVVPVHLLASGAAQAPHPVGQAKAHQQDARD